MPRLLIKKSPVLLLLFSLVFAVITIVDDYFSSKGSFSGDKSIWFVNVNVVPMTYETVLKNHAVKVEGTKITEIVPSKIVDVPEGAVIIDGHGSYLMPGLADMHMHVRESWRGDEWPVSPLKLYLANGVTTIRNFGSRRGKSSPPEFILNWRKLIERGELDGPTIYSCGWVLYGPAEDPEKEVLHQKAAGFDFIKLYSFITSDDFHAAMKKAESLDMYVAGHIPFSVGLERTLDSGMNEIAHVEEMLWEFVDFDRNRALNPKEWMTYVIENAFEQLKPVLELDYEDLRARYRVKLLDMASIIKQAGAPVDTTLFLDEVIVEKLHQPDKFLGRPELQYMPARYLKLYREGKEKHQVQFRDGEIFAPFKRKLDLAVLWALKEKRVPVLLATDSGTGGMGIVPGYSIHDELRILTENCFTPYEAIAAGTVAASETIEDMTGRNDFGTIEPGKRADLLLIEGNPLEDVKNIKNIKGVMAAGRWYDAERLRDFFTVDPK